MATKIGLLTLPLKHNYGGIIQIAALKSYLDNLGFETVFLNKHYTIPRLRLVVRSLSLWNPFYKIHDFNDNAKRDKYLGNLKTFVERELAPSTKSIYNLDKLKHVVEELNLDAVIVGSDQVWRMDFIRENYRDYFLGFLDGNKIKKIAYAASFGESEWKETNVVPEVKNLLGQFDDISVREDTGVKICKEVFDVENADFVLDPTFLPAREYYERIMREDFGAEKEVQLFNYVLDRTPVKNEIINNTAQKLDLGIDSLYLDNDLDEFKNNKTLKPSMGEWLYHFKNADFIVTDSFHGIVFSILFNKNFIAIGNTSRGLTRFTSLLKQLNLLDRLVLDWDENHVQIIDSEIDYKTVNKLVADLKKSSGNFLIEALAQTAKNE